MKSKKSARQLLNERLGVQAVSERNSRGVSGTIWPSGDFSYGAVRMPSDEPWQPPELEYVAEGDRYTRLGRQPLNLSNVPKSHSSELRSSETRAKRGMKGITANGRKMIKSGGAIIKRRYPRHRVTFCTVTMPPLPESERRELVELWSELVRQLLQRLSRQLARLALPRVVLSVTEIQPKRLTEYGEAYLHLHLVWLNPPGRAGNWAVCPNDVRGFVESFLARKLGLSEVGHVNVNVKPVRASIAGYMSKYMSKGSAQLTEAQEDWGEDCCPSAWWNMTKVIRDAIKDEICRGSGVGELLEAVVNHALDAGVSDFFHWLRHVELEFQGAFITVGWRGWLKEDCWEDLTSLLKSA